ncbi:hypothetical protein [Sphingomonas jaspsi]|nr:hypothetical protein [Sphingomonas jaspsi]
MTYTLHFAGQPVTKPYGDWRQAADAALALGLATRVFGCIFQLLPGASIK